MARLLCDIYTPDEQPFAGCPRTDAQAAARPREEARLHDDGGLRGRVLPVRAGARRLADHRRRTTRRPTSTSGPLDKGEEIRRVIVEQLVEMGFEVEAAHHEVAQGQHEIDFKYADALVTADNLTTFKFIVRNVANRYGYIASFMPKPIQGINGSGMHTHQSLFRGKDNAFYDPKAEYQLSRTALSYIEGLLQHARGFCAITNPLINSYKRLVPGYEAPSNVAWSTRNRSPLVRIPDRRGLGTRCELRMPDPACNPYLALTVQLAAGLDGVERKLEAREPVHRNIFTMSFRDRRKYRIDELPRDLHEALEMFEKDDVVKDGAGRAPDRAVPGGQAERGAAVQPAGEPVGDRYVSGAVLGRAVRRGRRMVGGVRVERSEPMAEPPVEVPRWRSGSTGSASEPVPVASVPLASPLGRMRHAFAPLARSPARPPCSPRTSSSVTQPNGRGAPAPPAGAGRRRSSRRSW